MLGDNEGSGTYTNEQQRLVRSAVDAEVLANAAFWRKVAAATGVARLSDSGDLLGIPPRPLSAMGSPGDLLLRPPEVPVVEQAGSSRWRRRRGGRSGGDATDLGLAPAQQYNTVTWMVEDTTLVGNTEGDLLRLAEIGARTLDMAGVNGGDGIVSLLPTGPSLASWQLTLGARKAGFVLAGLQPRTPCETVALLGPTVLAGDPEEVVRVLGGLSREARAEIRTLLVTTRGPLEQRERDAVRVALGRTEGIVEVWSPLGARALWSQCRGGQGVHTWPQCELVEVCTPNGDAVGPGEEGELVWTGLGWRGTVLVRLATGVRGRLAEGICENCGRTTPRIIGARMMAPPVRARATASRAAAAPPSGPPPGKPAPSSPTPDTPPRTVRVARPDGSGVRSGMNEEAPGLVRAMAKEDPPKEALPSEPIDEPQAAPVRAPSPRPRFGAAGADAAADVWFPGTSDVDAWPAPVLASTHGLAAWQVEHRTRRGHDELVVHLALVDDGDLGEVLFNLERSIGATQYVVVDQATIEARVVAANGRKVVDRGESKRN